MSIPGGPEEKSAASLSSSSSEEPKLSLQSRLSFTAEADLCKSETKPDEIETGRGKTPVGQHGVISEQ